MAQVKLYRDELDDLPDVCARSGESPTRPVRKTFNWHPPWVFLLLPLGVFPYFLVAFLLTKRMSVPLPLCDRHVNHWLLRNSLIYGGFLGIVLLAAVGVMLLDDGRDGPPPGALLCNSCLLCLVAWIVMRFVLKTTAIRPVEITDESITLIRVSRKFVEAVRERQTNAGENEKRCRALERWQRDAPPSTEFRT